MPFASDFLSTISMGCPCSQRLKPYFWRCGGFRKAHGWPRPRWGSVLPSTHLCPLTWLHHHNLGPLTKTNGDGPVKMRCDTVRKVHDAVMHSIVRWPRSFGQSAARRPSTPAHPLTALLGPMGTASGGDSQKK